MTTLADKAILSGADNHPPMLEKDMYDLWKSIMELYMLNRQHGRMILESVENGPLLWPTVEEIDLADKAILSGADNRPPMLEKDMYDSWKSRMELYMLNRQHGRVILEYVENGPLLWPTVEEDGVTRLKKYSELSAAETIQADCDVNTKFLNTLPPEWSKFVTDVKLYHPHQYTSHAPSSSNLSISYPPNDIHSSVNHNVYMASSSIPQMEYALTVHQQYEFSSPKTGLIVLVFQKGDDLIDAINHMMSFLTAVVTSRNISVNVGPRLAYVQAGAQIGELYYNIWKASNKLAFSGGVCPTMRIGGHISGGGYGAMLRKYGLSVDNVVDAEIVDVNGRILDRKSMGEDLFWAIGGGGGASFGVILSYTVKLVDVPEIVTVFRVERVLEEHATDLVNRWQYTAPIIDNRLFIRLLIQPVTIKPYRKTIRATFIVMFLGNGQELLGVTNKEFPELGVNNDVHEMSWIESVLYLANFDNTTKPEILLNRHSNTVGFGKRKSDYFQTPIPKTGLDLIFKKMVGLGKVGFVWNPYGGVMAQIPSSATPFPHRAGFLWKMQYSINWKDAGMEKEYLNHMLSLYDFMTPYASNSPRGAFLNYRDIDIGVDHNGANSYAEGKVYGEKYFLGAKNEWGLSPKAKVQVLHTAQLDVTVSSNH
nr:reticuline oxidase-like protein [Tanacetum cinerariifolium]GEY37541.1 reticuline oxidase-like protein [Tanacetum cinerariifolium]